MAGKKPDGGVRLGARLDIDTAALLELLAFATNENTGHVIQMALLALFDALPKGQRETISRAMPLRQASLARLRKSCGPAVAESAPEPAGQGSGATTGSDMLAGRLADIQSRTVDQPIGDALASLYGN